MNKQAVLKTAKRMVIWAVAAYVVVKVVKPLLEKIGNQV